MNTINDIMDEMAYNKTLERLHKAKQAGRKKAIEEEIERIEREVEILKN